MKFTITKNDIVDVLSNIQGLTSRKSNLAITENVLIKTKDDGLLFTATDLETGYEGFYPATVEKSGIIAINARKLYEIIKEFPSQSIIINEIETRWIEIGSQKIQYHILGMNSDDFPETPILENIEFMSIDTQKLKKMIEKLVIISGTTDDKRAHINGVFFTLLKKEDSSFIQMVSTDGSRLSIVENNVQLTKDLPKIDNVLIPKKGLVEVGKFLKNTGKSQIGIKNNNFIVKTDNETIIIRLLEGNFPDYKSIFDKENSHKICFSKDKFCGMLKRMSILSSEKYKGAIFTFLNNKLTITVTNPDIGESREDFDIDYKWDDITVAFNPKFFMEIANSIEDDLICLRIIDKKKPCQIRGKKDTFYQSLIMPMRI